VTFISPTSVTSRWEEAGVGTHVVSKMLGHSNLKTTAIYINANERQLHNAARRIDELRDAVSVAKTLQTTDEVALNSAAEPYKGNPAKQLLL